MDERTLKRLLITLVVAIAIIMLAKFMLTNTFSRLNQAAAHKKKALAKPQAEPAVILSQTIIQPESAPASAVVDAGLPASAVANIAQ